MSLVGAVVGALIGIGIGGPVITAMSGVQVVGPAELIACLIIGVAIGMGIATIFVKRLTTAKQFLQGLIKKSETGAPPLNDLQDDSESAPIRETTLEGEEERTGGDKTGLESARRRTQPTIESQTGFYAAGQTLRQDTLPHVKHRAESDLYDSLKNDEFCYVRLSPKIGKSSLMVHTAIRLRKDGVTVVVLDLMAIGQALAAEQWYHGLLSHIGHQLNLENELEDFWGDNKHLGPPQRWITAIREVVLSRRKGKLVVFVDEIDAVRNLPFSTDEFFTTLRQCYSRRAEDSAFFRLGFALFGMASPLALVSDNRSFGIDRHIVLDELTDAEAAPSTVDRTPDEKASSDRASRQPNLVQRLCFPILRILVFFPNFLRFLFGRGALRATLSGGVILAVLVVLALVAVRERDQLNRVVAPLQKRLSQISAQSDHHGPPLQHHDWVIAVAFSPDGKLVATASADMTARLWNVASGKPHSPPLQHQGRVMSVAFSPDGKLVATASWDKTARLWDVASGKPHGPPLQHPDRVVLATFSQDGKVVAAELENKTVRLWDATSGRLISSPSQGGAGMIAVASPDGKFAAVVSGNNTVQLWSIAEIKPHGSPLQHQAEVMSTKFSPDGKLIATASADNTARLWSVESGAPRGESLQHQDGVMAVEFSPDGRLVATASSDKTARLWDVEAGKPHGEPMEHQDGVMVVAFSPDGTLLATASRDGTARLWNVR